MLGFYLRAALPGPQERQPEAMIILLITIVVVLICCLAFVKPQTMAHLR